MDEHLIQKDTINQYQDSQIPQNTYNKFNISLGITLSFINSFLMIAIGVLFKIMYLNYSFITSFHLLLYKGFVELILIIVALILFKRFDLIQNQIFKKQNNQDISNEDQQIHKLNKQWLLIIVVLGTLANILVIAGLQYVYISLGTLINNTFPIFVTIMAYFIARETVNSSQIAIIIIALSGVILLSYNSLQKEKAQDRQNLQQGFEIIGILMILLSELFGSISFVSVKRLKNVNVVTVIFYKFICIFIVSGLYLLTQYLLNYSTTQETTGTSNTLDLYGYLIIAGIALLDISINYLMIKSMQIEKAALVTSMNFLCLVWALIVDILIFDQSFSKFEMLCGLFIFISTTSIIFTN